MAGDRLFPGFGELNPVEPQLIGKTLDPRNTKPIDSLRQSLLNLYKKDSFENSGPLKGIVLRIDNNPNDVEPNSWISQIFGLERIFSLKVLKVRIPEIHAALPEPSNYGSNAGESNKVIDMYPSFLAINEEVSNKPVAPGDIVLVDFVNRVNLTQPIYLGPVLSNPTPGAVGEKSAQEVFNKQEAPVLNVELPKGDEILASDKKEENQIPVPINANSETTIPQTIAEVPTITMPENTNNFHYVTFDEIKKIMPRATKQNIDKYLTFLNEAMITYEMNTPKRQAAFLAQLALESGQLKYDLELPSKYSGNPVGILYEGRKNLGNNQPGDGVKFPGRGLLQLTGRSNYTIMTKKLKGMGFDVDLVENPEKAAEPKYSALIAGQYFKDRNLNAYADVGDIDTISRKVNGGDHGILERKAFYLKGLEVLEKNV